MTSTAKTRRRGAWIAVFLLIALASTATGFYIRRSGERPPGSDPTRLVRPERRTVATSVNATGTVRLRVGSEVRVGSQLSGIVRELNVTVGSHVKAGDVIAQIDDTPIQARLAQAEAQAQLDEASMRRAAVNTERAQQLGAQGLIPVQQVEDLQLALAEAKAKLEKSLRDRDLVKVDLGYVRIHAPISGTVASVSTQEGETVAASFTAPTFVTIIGDNALQLVAMVDETDIASVRRGNQVVFLVDSYPSQEFTGIVESVAPKATIVSGVVNYEVTIRITKDADLLKPDMTANVTIRTAQHEALFVPAEAVRREGDQSFVVVLGGSAAEKKPVAVGGKDGGNVEIKRGITDNDQLMIAPPGSQPADTDRKQK